MTTHKNRQNQNWPGLRKFSEWEPSWLTFCKSLKFWPILILTMVLTFSCSDYERNIEAEQNAAANKSQSSSSVGADNNQPSSSSSDAESSSSVAVMLSSSGNAVQAWCVYAEQHLCFQVSLSECPGNGVMLPECPLSSSGSVPGGNSSSSDIGGASSSSVEEPPAYAYCVFALSQICLPGPFASYVCVAMDGEPGNTCPYASSSSSSIGAVSPSSSSSDETSSSSVGADNHQPSSSSDETPSSSSQQQESSSSTSLSSSSSANDSSSSIASSSSQQQSSSGTGSSEGSFVYEGQTYKTVKIGTQTWMAENLNYNVTGSKCYGNSESNCDTYGRLYDWATAMNLDASCNSSTCASQVQPKHRGICPEGWHMPTNAEWNELCHYADGTLDGSTNLSPNYNSSTAGKHLKAEEGWNSYSGIVNMDTHGFAALPGGHGNSDGSFDYVGDHGLWWSASEFSAYNAYRRSVGYNDGYAYWFNPNKSFLLSVRCLQDQLSEP